MICFLFMLLFGLSKSFESKNEFKISSYSKELIRKNAKINSSLHLNSNLYFRQKNKFKSQVGVGPETVTKLPEGFVSWFEGWVHYYKYNNDTDISRPTMFFVNSKFFNQRTPVKDLSDKDDFGKKIIPDKNSFYLVLNKDSMNVYSTRNDPFLNQVDNLDYSFIEAIPLDKKYEGGVQDMFRFSIGYCIMVKVKLALELSSQTSAQRWIFCVNKEEEKMKLLQSLIKAKLYSQSKSGEIVSSEALAAQKSNENIADFLRNKRQSSKEDDLKKNQTAVDGYWITLQDWTECNMKCGGGLSFKQKMCVPPKGSGRPCIGDSVESKECNTQACPEIKSYLKQIDKNKPVIKNPIVKIGSFSNRPQRYVKCKIKDVDAFYSHIDKDTMTEMRIPVRVVMNNHTISVYKSDEYTDVTASFELKDSLITVPDNSFCCLNISDKLKTANICGYDKNCGSVSKNEWVVEWKKDFNTFKNLCHNGIEESLLDGDDEAALSQKAKDKIKQANLDISKAKKRKVKDEVISEQTDNLRKNLIETQKTGFEAIEKELDIENMLKEEEKQKEVDDINLLKKKLETESEKLKCIKENIQEKEIDNDFIAQQHQVDSDIVQIKQEFSSKILKKREKLKNLLDKMRKKSKMDKKKLESEIKTLRNKIAEDLLTIQKNGSIEFCREGKVNLDKRVAYCDKNFVDDFINNGECKKDEEFCYLCCETEFGNSFMNKREACFTMCDLKEEVKENEKIGDHWAWRAK